MSFRLALPLLALCLASPLTLARAQGPQIHSPARTGQFAGSTASTANASRQPGTQPQQRGSQRTPLKLTPEGETSPKQQAGESGSWWTSLGALLVVLTLMVGLGQLWRKFVGTSSGTASPAALEVLGRRTLDHRQTLHLVKCGRRVLVVGSGPNGLVSLGEIEDAREVEHLVRMSSSEKTLPGARSFLSLLSGENASAPASPSAGSPLFEHDRQSTSPTTPAVPEGRQHRA